MDSLTQIVLGAAVGEAVLGKKIGNRAMLWGAIGGTIPDLDILANGFMDKIDSLAFHRGISHSISFAIILGLFLAWLLHRCYRWKNKHWLEWSLATLFFTLITVLLGFIAKTALGWFVMIFFIPFFIFGLWKTWKDFIINKDAYQNPTIREWQWLWFLVLVTHPILDSFTQFGTQLFAPFSYYRVAFNNISVADPIYTFPFLGFLVVASFYWNKNNSNQLNLVAIKKRRFWNWMGIAISSLYMTFTVFNKLHVNTIVENSMVKEGYANSRYTVGPTILNNLLWSATVETDSIFFHGSYSLLDTDPYFKFVEIPKNHFLIADAKEDDKTINILKWFSNNFYSCMQLDDGVVQINDMRYGTFRNDEHKKENYIFHFMVKKDENGYYKMIDEQRGPPDRSESQMFKELWDRIKGV